MLLAFDVGNTNIKIGVYAGDTMIHHLRLATRPDQTPDEYGLLLRDLLLLRNIEPDQIHHVLIGSVVPPLNATLAASCQNYFQITPIIAKPSPALGLQLGAQKIRAIGIDRLLGAAAAYAKYGGPVITCHLGTATTYNAVNKDGSFLGGAIAPGLGIAAEALFERTAKLPRIELLPVSGSAIGRNTVASMQAGIYYGFVAGVDAMIDRLRHEIGAPEAPAILTGGFAPLVSSGSRTATETNPHLTLEGLRYYYLQLDAADT